jgi:hypothetical protein
MLSKLVCNSSKAQFYQKFAHPLHSLQGPIRSFRQATQLQQYILKSCIVLRLLIHPGSDPVYAFDSRPKQSTSIPHLRNSRRSFPLGPEWSYHSQRSSRIQSFIEYVVSYSSLFTRGPIASSRNSAGLFSAVMTPKELSAPLVFVILATKICHCLAIFRLMFELKLSWLIFCASDQVD